MINHEIHTHQIHTSSSWFTSGCVCSHHACRWARTSCFNSHNPVKKCFPNPPRRLPGGRQWIKLYNRRSTRRVARRELEPRVPRPGRLSLVVVKMSGQLAYFITMSAQEAAARRTVLPTSKWQGSLPNCCTANLSLCRVQAWYLPKRVPSLRSLARVGRLILLTFIYEMQSISTCKSNGLTTWSSMPALPSASVVPGAAFSCVHFFPAGWSARYNATSLQYFCMTKGSVPSPCCRGESLATHRHTRRDHDLVRNRSTVEFVNLPGGRGRYEWLAWQQADAGGSLWPH